MSRSEGARGPVASSIARALTALMIASPIVAIVILLHPWPRHGLDRVKHILPHAGSCDETIISPARGLGSRWVDATQTASVGCDDLGPFLVYARFGSEALLREDLLGDPPDAATCLRPREVLVDGLERGQFPGVCRKFGGHEIIQGTRNALWAYWHAGR